MQPGDVIPGSWRRNLCWLKYDMYVGEELEPHVSRLPVDVICPVCYSKETSEFTLQAAYYQQHQYCEVCDSVWIFGVAYCPTCTDKFVRYVDDILVCEYCHTEWDEGIVKLANESGDIGNDTL